VTLATLRFWAGFAWLLVAVQLVNIAINLAGVLYASPHPNWPVLILCAVITLGAALLTISNYRIARSLLLEMEPGD